MADSIPSDVNILETLQHEMIDHYFLAAGGALFIYDVFINLDVELMYIWPAVNLRKRPINKVSVAFNFMYLAQRYLPLVDQVILDQYILFGAPSTTACMIGFTMSAWCSILGILLSELMLALRIWAVWERSAFIGVILIALSLGCSAPAMFFFARFMQGIQYFEFHLSRPSQDIGRCLNLMTNRDVYICWILLMVYDSASFILMAIPGFRAYREGGSSDLVKLVYRDGVIYYALLFLVSLVNVIIILLLPHDLVIIISPFERVLHSIVASRAILHIRKLAFKDYIEARDTSDGTMTTVDLTAEFEMSFSLSIFRPGVDSELEAQNPVAREHEGGG